jgi:hypothetical protein
LSDPTPRLGLTKPVGGDVVSALRTSIAGNADKLDTALGRVLGGLQEGVIDAGSYMVTQASGGASTTVDVASHVGTGAYVQDDSVGGQALYYVAPTVAKTPVTIAAAHLTLPRVDAVVVSLAGVVSIVAGTATAGATLNNARDGSHGGAGVPANALHLADLLVAPASTAIDNTMIRDRRKWARGAYAVASGYGGGLPPYGGVTSSATLSEIAAALALRVECSGAPIKARLIASWGAFAADKTILFDLFVDGAATQGSGGYRDTSAAADSNYVALEWDITPPAGSHVFTPAFASPDGTTTVAVPEFTSQVVTFTVEETVRQQTANNAVTSG